MIVSPRSVDIAITNPTSKIHGQLCGMDFVGHVVESLNIDDTFSRRDGVVSSTIYNTMKGIFDENTKDEPPVSRVL